MTRFYAFRRQSAAGSDFPSQFTNTSNFKKLLFPLLLVVGFLGFFQTNSFGQCNPTGNVSRYEFNVDPTIFLNLVGQQFCTSQSEGTNCCGQQSSYRCLDLVFNLSNGPLGEPFTGDCNGAVNLMTAQGNFDALYFSVGTPNPTGNGTNCATPINLGNNYTISVNFTGNNMGQITVDLSVTNNMNVVTFSASQVAMAGQSVIFTICKPGFGCVEDEVVFGCCNISGTLALAANAPSTICAGSSTTLKLTGLNGTAPYTAAVRAMTASGVITNFNVTIPDDGDANTAMDMINYPVSPAENTTYSLVSITDASGCAQPGDNQNVAITVNPVPQVDPVANQTYCAGASVPATVFTSSTPGVVFSWSRTNEAIGLGANSGTGNVPSFTATNSGTTPLTSTFSVVATYTANGVTCTGTPVQYTVTVNPNPQVNAVANQTYCAGASVPSVVFTSDVPGATFSWSRTNEAIGLGANSGTGDIPSFTATNAGTTPLTSTFSVVASFTNNGVTCTGTPIQFTITVNPNPQVNAVANQTYCAGSSVPSVVFTSNVPGATFSWSRTNEAIGLGTNSGTGNVPSFTATNAGTTPLTSTFSVVASFTNNGVTCTGTPIQFTITVNPNPQVNPVANQTHCAGAIVPATVFSSNVAGATFSWSRTNEAIGLVANSGTGNLPSFTATNTGTTPLTSTISVVASFTNNGVTCTGTPIQFTITVNPLPVATATPSAQTICSGSTITTIALSSNVANTTYAWSRNNTTTVTGIAANGTGNISGALTNTTNAPITVTFTITPTANNCTGNAITATVLVNPVPVVFAVTGGGVVCTTDTDGVPVGLSGSQTNVNYQLFRNASPVGSPVAGTGAAISFGNQVAAGTYTVVATHTQGGCTNNMSGSATVTTFNCSAVISNPCVCLNNATTLTNGQFGEQIKVNAPTSQTWTVTAVNGFYSTNSAAPPVAPTPITVGTVLQNIGGNMFTLDGRHVDALGYTITIANARGTSFVVGNSCQYPNPVITSDLAGPFCLYSDPVTLTGDPGDANIVSQSFTVNGQPATQFNPGAGIGQYTIVYTVNGGTPKASGPNDPGCIQSVTQIVNVVTTPAAVACNDLVQISLDEDCQAEITPDMVLEGTYFCYDDYKVELDKIIPLGNGPWVLPFVGAGDINKTYAVKVTHLVSGNSCWGLIKIEDKLAPVVVCESFNVACAETNYDAAYLANTLGIEAAYPDVTENCGTYTQSYTDQWFDLPCPPSPTQLAVTAYIIRTWVVTDASGNSATCTQTINIVGARVYDVQFPADVTISCSANVNTNPAATGVPFVTFDYPAISVDYPIWPGSNHCELQSTYTDQILPVCDGTYKILRTWTVYDWCVPTSPFPPTTNPQYYIQLIKVIDDAGPTFACPADMTVSTDAYTCCASVDLPEVIMSDGCSRIDHVSARILVYDQYTGDLIATHDVSGWLTTFPGNNLWNPDTMANFGITPCIPIGQHTVIYTATDNCGNHSTCSFELEVRDLTPPVVACDEWTQVALGINGMAFVNATTFDDGSYDNCGPVYFKARRMDANDCQSNNNFYDQVKFCCEDIGDTIMVVLRVYDVNPGTGNVGLEDFEGHYNDCMVQALVEDKIKPACSAPANVTVSCEAFDPSYWAYGQATAVDNCCVDTITGTVVLSQFDSLCNKGTITRRWTAIDCSGNTSQCTQRIIVTYNQNYYVKFPADRLVSTCDGTGNYGAPEFYGEDCELLATSFNDEIFTVVPDACYKIERTWTVINWCTYNPNLGCIYVPNPNPSNTTNAPANLAGVTVSECGNTVLGWNPTVVKINPNDPQATNYCTFWNANANCYQYKQIIKIYDTQDPTVVAPTPSEFCDYSANDGAFWNASYWWDATISSHDLCEGDANIELTATDACSGANLQFRYLLFLDLDGDGVMETVVNSVNPPGYNNIQFGNANNPNYGGGESRQFDFRNVPFNQKWGFGLQVDAANGANRSARVRWFNQLGQNAVPQLPYGNHKIKWFIEDGCGNEYVYEQPFVVKDCKKPTVVCLNGLSVNLMNTTPAMVQLWASDFLQYTEDNCTPSAQLKIAIRRSGTGTGFPVNPDGTPQTGVTFDCNDLGTQLVELWSIDKAGNADFCETYVLIQDNMGVCGPVAGMATVAGALKTPSTEEGVEGANVELNGSTNGTPSLNTVFSNVSGNYVFSNALPIASSATVTPTLELDPLNGVNTYDLILISRHILGLEPLNTPYKLIGADANKSGTITTFDIVELRKLILGTYTELPNNSSWRFVDKAQVFAQPDNPFAETIREVLTVGNIQNSILNGDFAGVKVGDVDETATPNNLVASDDRTNGTLLFDVDDQQVKVGDVFEVAFKSADRAQGYQFTMNLTNLEVVRIEPGANMTTDNFAVFGDAVTTSADGSDGQFIITFRANANGQLSKMINVSSRITKAVAFDAAGLKQDVAFRFNNKGASTITGLGFEVYQNVPNPWVNKTQIGFYLPEATAATLTVYDATGRTLYTATGDFGKGYNAFTVDRKMVETVGNLYYKVSTATVSGVKQMIQVK